MKKTPVLLRLGALILLFSLLLGGCTLPQILPVDTTGEPAAVTTLPESADATLPPVETETDPATDPTEEIIPTTTRRTQTTTKPEQEQTDPPATEPETEPVTTPVTEPTTEPTTAAPTGSSGFKVYFIDVGQADAALIVCDGKTMLIDGGNSADSNLIYSVLKKRGVTHLDYLVATHAHEDHVGGLAGALQYATVDTVYCPVKSYSSNAFNNFAKAVSNRGKSITIPTVGTTFSLGSAKCTVLAVNTTSDANNSSIVLRIVYGSTSFLFMGDAERDVEDVLINRGYAKKTTVLKVGHHGSYTSSSYAFLWNVMPQYAVISCGKGNSYGHPHDQVLSRLHDADVFTFRTDLQGDITCTSNGSTVKFSVSRNWDADVFGELGGNTQTTTVPTTQQDTQPVATEPEATEEDTTAAPTTEPAVTENSQEYILNTNSMKFHYAFCEWAQKISDRNRQEYTGSRDDLLEWGYTPCGACQP